MREKYLWLAVSVLTALTMGQACYIYEGKAVARDVAEQPPLQPEIHREAHADKAYAAQLEELEKWRRKVREQINQGFPLMEPDFDVFFGDRFFAARPDPFREMELVRKELSGEFRDSDKTLFDGYWDKWFKQRMMMDQFKTEISRTDREITITIQLPALTGKTANIDITNERIKLSFEARPASEHKTAGGVLRSESLQRYVKILPVPADAAAGTGKAGIEGDTVIIKFARTGN